MTLLADPPPRPRRRSGRYPISDPNRPRWAKAFEARRLQQGIDSQSSLARLSKVSQAIVSAIERGEYDMLAMKPATLSALLATLNWLPSQFVQETGLSVSVAYPGNRTSDSVSGAYVQVAVTIHTHDPRADRTLTSIESLTLAADVAAMPHLEGLRVGILTLDAAPLGAICLHAFELPQPGESCVVLVNGARYAAFMLEGGRVEVDHAPTPDLPLRFRPDQVLGKIVGLELPVPRR